MRNIVFASRQRLCVDIVQALKDIRGCCMESVESDT